MDPILYWLVFPAILVFGSLTVGYLSSSQMIPMAGGALLVALVAVAVGLLFAGGMERDPAVSHDDVVEGYVISCAFMVAVAAAYFALGLWITRHRVWALGILVVSVVPLYVVWFVVLIAVADLIECGPDAYECPL